MRASRITDVITIISSSQLHFLANTRTELAEASKLHKTSQQKTHNLFWLDENSIEQCFAAHIVQGCQQYCSTLLHLIAG